MRLAGKLAVITAAASGMGRAGVELFVREGARVVAVDVDANKLDALVAEFRAKGADVQGVVADLTKVEACKQFVDDAAKLLGGIDILWNHAGMPGPAGVENLDMQAYETAHALNVTSGIIASGQVISHMRKRGGGSIIFTASVSGIVGSMLSPIYSSQKFAVVGLTMSLAQRFAPDKVRVNAICPGPIDTAMLPGFLARDGGGANELAANTQKVLAAIPMGRVGRPEEIAHAALWLASDDSSYVTGIALPVDGGMVCR
jgi:NAD(P)-dependent dehydrogenase (short-subunit alcohol dehydrogenase family)